MAASPRSPHPQASFRSTELASISPQGRYITSQRSIPTTPTQPPRGPCNWRNLQGAQTHTCGCRRFWSRASTLEAENEHQIRRLATDVEKFSCFCGHHACFHCEQPMSDGQLDSQQQASTNQHGSQAMPPPSVATGSSKRKSRSESKPSSKFGQDRRSVASVSRDSVFGEPRRPRQYTKSPSQSQAAKQRSGLSGLGLYVESTRNQPLSNRLSNAAQFAMIQYPPAGTPSRMTPTEIDSERSEPINASPNRQFFEQVIKRRAQMPGLGIDPSAFAGVHPDELAQSATEIATPSNTGTPALKDMDETMDQVKVGVENLQQDVLRLHGSPKLLQGVESRSQHSQEAHAGKGRSTKELSLEDRDHVPSEDDLPSLHTLIKNVASLRHLLAESPNLGVSVAKLGQRVDALEAVSFAHSAVEEHSERFENVDGRILDVESRLEELEAFCKEWLDTDGTSQEDISEIGTRDVHLDRLDQGPAPSVDIRTNLSFISSKLSAVRRLRNIEKRLLGLNEKQKLGAGVSNIEVVYLPWGPNLKGIWRESKDCSPASQVDSHISTASLDRTQSASLKHLGKQQRTHGDDLPIVDAILDEWAFKGLAAKALGPTSGVGGRVYERLKSRGYVQNVTFSDGSARNVYETLCRAFSDQLDQESKAYSRPVQHNGNNHLAQTATVGLRGAFVPLRKVHKHSRLRYLSEAELMNPAIWTLPFLESSVFMKAPSASVMRLFITTPSAYLQSERRSSWTWQKLRELPRVPSEKLAEASNNIVPDVEDEGVPEADAFEPCWEYESKIDPSPSQQTSFASNVSFESSHHPSPPRSKPGMDEDDVVEDPDYEEASSDANFSEYTASAASGRLSHHPAPITPTSDFPIAGRSSMLQRRTASLPALEGHPAAHITLNDQPHPKRAVSSFEHVVTSSNTDGVALSSRPSSSLSKRRRLSRTPSGRAGQDDAAWALTPGKSNVTDEAEAAYVEHQRAGVKLSAKERGAAAYATPYSFGMGKSTHSTRAVEDISAPSFDDDDDDSYTDASKSDSPSKMDEDSDSGSSRKIDPTFGREPPRSVESEVEIDAAVTMEEEIWEGMADDEDQSDMMERGKRRWKRTRASERDRKRAESEELEGLKQELGNDSESEEEDFIGFDEEEAADNAVTAPQIGWDPVDGGDDSDDDMDELGEE